MTIRYLHWDQVDPFEYKRAINGFDSSERFQTIAVDHGRIIGRWEFRVRLLRSGRPFIDSFHTRVASAYRQRGVARELWKLAIERWNACRIDAGIGSINGCHFLANMTVWLAESMPDVHLNVTTNEWCERFGDLVRERALERLAKRATTSRKMKRLALVP